MWSWAVGSTVAAFSQIIFALPPPAITFTTKVEGNKQIAL
jgi:hypothetical protein